MVRKNKRKSVELVIVLKLARCIGIMIKRIKVRNVADFCMILGYLATPGRVGFIEAQIPENRVWEFENCYPDQEYYPITQGETSGGNTMKQGC